MCTENHSVSKLATLPFSQGVASVRPRKAPIAYYSQYFLQTIAVAGPTPHSATPDTLSPHCGLSQSKD